MAADAHGLGLWRDLVKSLGVHLLPDLDQIAVSPLRQSVHHFRHMPTPLPPVVPEQLAGLGHAVRALAKDIFSQGG